MPSSRDIDMTGFVCYYFEVQNPVQHFYFRNALSDDCNTLINNNQGCSVEMTDTRSFDGIFNDKGGGLYVINCSLLSMIFSPLFKASLLRGQTRLSKFGFGPGLPRVFRLMF